MWYRVGTVALTKNSKVVTGSGTYWLSADIHPGDLFSVDSVTEYEVYSVDSNTQITLKTAYAGATTSETDYRIIRNFTATMAAQVAAHTASLLNDFRRYVDSDMQSIHGKSAYQIACEKGFAGTESQWVESLKGLSAYDVAVANGYEGTAAQWLESLKAAGEWSALDSRTEILTGTSAGYRNSIFRGKNLGAFTAEHLAAIRAGTFGDMMLGDFFTFSGDSNKYRIAGFNYWWKYDDHIPSIMVVPDNVLTAGECSPYKNLYNWTAIGTEGEDGYIESTAGKHYAESNWYVNVMPKYLAKLKGLFGEDALQNFTLRPPAGFDESGNVSALVNLPNPVHLMPMGMIFGDNYVHPRSVGGPWKSALNVQAIFPQLPLFMVCPSYIFPHNNDGQIYSAAETIGERNGTAWVWDVASSAYGWTAPSTDGNARLRPVFRVG